MPGNVSICVRAGLPKPRGVPDTERTKDTKTLDYASTPLDANTLLVAVGHCPYFFVPLLFYNSVWIISRIFIAPAVIPPTSCDVSSGM
jgi:hypothetical protein